MTSLANQFLVAMPTLDESYFGRTLIYVCEHDDEGAMGIVINKPTDLTIGQVLSEMNLIEQDSEENTVKELNDKTVLAGGPVQTDRGFILHNDNNQWSSSLNLAEQITVTTSKDILENLTSEQRPEQFIMALGYAGWSAGQLEQELADNTWLTLEADPQLIFNTPIAKSWDKALEKIGISAEQLTSFSGHA
ncbi:MAG: YqgE/AlgH family protein [Gammaproteobacteria bacterium]|nr:YqgE/AlgH family protein [Gammaproteobacteria bacterium]